MAHKSIAVMLILVGLVGGAWLRLSGLERRSISHPEMYVPGIPLPEGISEPAPRMTISRILTGTFSSDTHPPGYYLFMFPWTRAVGTSLLAMRLPSAILGLACIVLLYWLGALAGRPLPGALAAALLAFNGYHVFWSQVARMFALACFLGLASTITLLLIVRGTRHRAALSALYVVLILCGVATHVFFWSLFAVHLIWTLGNAWGKGGLPDFCRVQLLALILGSPLIAFAMYQSGNTVAELTSNVLTFLSQFVPFAFALPVGASGFFAGPVPLTGTTIFSVLRGAVVVLAAGLLAGAVWNLWKTRENSEMLLKTSSQGRWWKVAWIAAALAATALIGGFVYMTRQLPPAFINPTIKITKTLAILPFSFAGVAFLLDMYWPRLDRPGRWMRFLEGRPGLLLLLGLGPFLLLALLAQIRPILNQRGFMFAAPYLLLLLSIGLLQLRPLWTGILIPALAVLCVASCISYRGMMVDPADYASFGTTLQSEIRPTDLVFIRKAWYTTPIIYYLRPDRYRLVGRNYAAISAENPKSRVWVVLLYDNAPSKDVQNAVSGYQLVRTITRPHTTAILYEPAGARFEYQAIR